MHQNNILMLKVMRLVIAILMVISIPLYMYLENYYTLPGQELIMSSFVSVFVFVLGLQYYIEEKMPSVTRFLMLFSLIMLVMSIYGMV